MLFSIVVPVYKVEDYLPSCVESILKQTVDDFELILVDDGSPDSCPQLCDKYALKDNRITVIHKANGGLSDARNAGINIARGEYIVFVDSDDYFAHSKVLKIIKSVIEAEKTDVVQYERQFFYQDTGKRYEKERKDVSKYDTLDKTQKIIQLIKDKELTVSAWRNAIKRTFLTENNLFFKVGIKSEDIEWAIRFYSHEPSISIINEPLYVYRARRPGSITSTKDYGHMCDLCDMIEGYINSEEKCLDEVHKAICSYVMYVTVMTIALCFRSDITKEQRKMILKRLKPVCKANLLQYTLDSRVSMAAKVYRYMGYDIMAYVLGLYLNHRGDKHSFKTYEVNQ